MRHRLDYFSADFTSRRSPAKIAWVVGAVASAFALLVLVQWIRMRPSRAGGPPPPRRITFTATMPLTAPDRENGSVVAASQTSLSTSQPTLPPVMAFVSVVAPVAASRGQRFDVDVFTGGSPFIKGSHLESRRLRHWSFAGFELVVSGPIEIPDPTRPSYGIVRGGASVVGATPTPAATPSQ